MDRYKVSSNLAISENGFLFFPSTGDSFTLNEIGSSIVGLLKSDKSKSEIIEAIVEEYDIDENSAERDVTDFITQLINFNLAEEL
jgi:hypothetical protein